MYREKYYFLGLDQIDLIFDFASWVIPSHPEDGLKIFTEDLPEVEELPRAKVYDFLYKNHRSLALSYLEHVVYEWQDSNALFHNALAVLYKDKILRLEKQLQADSSDPTLRCEYQDSKAKLRSFLEVSRHCSPEAILVQFPYDCKKIFLYRYFVCFIFILFYRSIRGKSHIVGQSWSPRTSVIHLYEHP